jgi:hypothetical protein
MSIVLAANLFDSKVINAKTEVDGMCGVMEEAVSVRTGAVAVGSKVFDEVFIGKEASLKQAIHAFVNLNHDIAIVNKRSRLVLLHDALYSSKALVLGSMTALTYQCFSMGTLGAGLRMAVITLAEWTAAKSL